MYIQEGVCKVTSSRRNEIERIISVDLDFATDVNHVDDDTYDEDEYDEDEYEEEAECSQSISQAPNSGPLPSRQSAGESSEFKLPKQFHAKSLTFSGQIEDSKQWKPQPIGRLRKKEVRKGVIHRSTLMHNRMMKLVNDSLKERSRQEGLTQNEGYEGKFPNASFTRGPGAIIGELSLDESKFIRRSGETVIAATMVRTVFVKHESLRKYFKVC